MTSGGRERVIDAVAADPLVDNGSEKRESKG